MGGSKSECNSMRHVGALDHGGDGHIIVLDIADEDIHEGRVLSSFLVKFNHAQDVLMDDFKQVMVNPKPIMV